VLVARELHHRDRLADALLVPLVREDVGRAAPRREEVVETAVEDLDLRPAGALPEPREPGMDVCALRQHVRDDARAPPALALGAEDRVRDAGPAREESEAVADAEERRRLVLEDVVEEPPERLLPAWVFLDALREAGEPVVLTRVEGAGSARADQERPAPA